MSTTRTLSVIVLLAVCLASGAGRETMTTMDSGQSQQLREALPVPVVTTRNETQSARQTPGMLEAVAWVRDRYMAAGMLVPDTTVRFHRSRSECAGSVGLHSVRAGHHQVEICIGGDARRRRVLLHEFAHAWVRDNVSEEKRQAFMAERGVPSWNDWSDEWANRGTEHAAVIIVWGMSEHCYFHEMVVDEDPARLVEAFEFLTGRAPLCTLEVERPDSDSPTDAQDAV